MRKIVRAQPFFSERDIANILTLTEQILRSGRLTDGPLVAEFERRFAEYVGVCHAVAVNSGTAALEIALRCVGVQGHEVIVPTETFVASVNSVILAGGWPVFAEIRPDTLCLDPADVAQRITDRTAAVIVVHMAGLIPPDLDMLSRLCRGHNLALIEDAAHAHGASIHGRKAGSLGRIGCFSFYPTKVITTGEGGMLTTDDDDVAQMARSYRNHGANPNGTDYVRVSTNWRLPEVSAAIGLTQLEHLDEFVERRNQIAQFYDAALSCVPGIEPLPRYPHIRHSYWNYIITLAEDIDRQCLAHLLANEYGVKVAWPYDPPCHLQPVFRARLGCSPRDLPVSERVLSHHLALPMHIGLGDDDVAYVVESLRLALERIHQP